MCYSRLLEYPSDSVDFNNFDPNVQIIFKEQDFIQIILRYLVNLFKTTNELYDFAAVYKHYKQEVEDKDEDESGFQKDIEHMIVPSTKENIPILSPKERMKIEFDVKKKHILLICYKILEAICIDNEINQNFLSQYLPIMQMHSFFFPEVITTISRLFSTNQEILLKLKKKSEYSLRVIDQAGLNQSKGFDLISCSSIDNQARALVQSFHNSENITSGASNIFYFYCYYLLKTDSMDIRQKILDLFTRVSFHEGDSINANQDEIYHQITSNFKDLIKTQFYTMSSRDNQLVVINPRTLRAMAFSKIFESQSGGHKDIGKIGKMTDTERSQGLGPTESRNLNRLKQNKSGQHELALSFSDMDDQEAPLNTSFRQKEKRIEEMPFMSQPYFTEESKNSPFNTLGKDDDNQDNDQLRFDNEEETGDLRNMMNNPIDQKFSAEQKRFILIQLNFYAGMMLDRNYIWKDVMEVNGFFSFDVLLNNFMQRFETFESNASLMKVLYEMYIDQKPMYEMLIPQYCKVVGTSNAAKFSFSPIKKQEAPQDSPEKRSIGYNLDLHTPANETKQIQIKLQQYFIELKKSLKSLPDTFDELRDHNNYDEYIRKKSVIINSFTREIMKTVERLFSFGQYHIKVLPSQTKYMPHILEKVGPESNITPLLRIMVRILEFEPEYPEAKLLITTLRKATKELKKNERKVGEYIKELKNFRYAEAYDKIIMVEDVEKKSDDTFDIYEAYFRQYMAKDIAFKNRFKYKDLTLEEIKSQIMLILERLLENVADSYVNRAMEVFEEAVTRENLEERLQQSEFIGDKNLITEIFKSIIEKQIDKILPPISYTGLSLDFMDPKLVELSKRTEPTFDIFTILGQSLFPSLLLLFTFNQESDLLSSKSIELLIKVFSQRVQMLRNIKEVSITQGREDVKQLQKIKRDLNSLKDLCDSSEIWIKSQDSEFRMKCFGKVVSTLDWFCRLLSSPSDENLGCFDIDNVSKFSVNKHMQDLFRNLKTHLVVIDFLRDTLSILADFYESATDPTTLFYFRALILFLRKFCHGHLRNQNLLAADITVFLQDCPVDVGQASLVIEIYQDNEVMCKTMQSLVTDDFIRWILKFGRRDRFIDFFVNLMKCNDTYLIDNQRNMLKMFLEHPRMSELLYISQEPNDASGPRRCKMDFKPVIDPENRFKYDMPYKYHAKIMKLMTYACAGKSSVFVNEVKIRNLFNLHYLLDLMFMQDALTDMDEYNKHEEGIEDYHPMDDDIKAISDLRKLKASAMIKSRKKAKTDDDEDDELSAHSPTRDKFNLKIQGVSSPGKRKVRLPRKEDRIRTTKISIMQKKKASLLRNINLLKIAIAELIYFVYFESTTLPEEVMENAGLFIKLFKHETERLRNVEKDEITPDYIEYFFGNLLRLAISIEGTLMKERDLVDDELLASFKMSSFINEFANKFDYFEDQVLITYQKNIEATVQFFNYDLGPRLSEVTKIAPLESLEIRITKAESSDIWQYLWDRFKDALQANNIIQECVSSEKMILSKALNQIEDLFKIPIIHNSEVEHSVKKILINVNKKRVIKSIIGFVVDNSKEQSRRNTISEVLFCLGGMIPLTKDGEVNDLNRVAVEKEQEFLDECGATEMIMKQLTDPSQSLRSDEYTLNLIRFASRLLEGGNSHIQGEFFQYMKTEASAEVFFSKVYYLFQRETEYVNKEMISPDLDLVLCVLELIQHFAEGHYQDLQLYMRLQTNSMRNYNILEELVTLLSSYISSKKKHYFELIKQCFGTITELIQGPCIENQKFLMQGRMMDTVGKLLAMDEFYLIEAERRELGINLPEDHLRPWMIAKIKHQCSITLISLVECRLDNVVLTKMYTNLKKFLFDNIISFYINFKQIYNKVYNEDALEHVEIEPSDKGKDELYCSVIIQTAFNYYTIIQKNQDVEEEDDSESSEEEQNDQLDHKVEEEKKELEDIEVQAVPEPTNLDDLKRYLGQHRVKAKTAAFEFMRLKTRTIEVVREDEYLEKVYFLTVPYFEAITKNIKDEFNLNVSRVSCKTKCNDLLEASRALLKKLRRERDILKNPVYF